MTLFDVIFSGNDTVYDLTVKAVDDAIAANGADKAVSFPHTAYSLPCYYGVTGTKITNLGDMKNALDVVKSLIMMFSFLKIRIFPCPPQPESAPPGKT